MDQAEHLRMLVRMKNQVSHQVEAASSDSSGPKIIAITSGKGGVGKTNLTLNLALSLSKESHKKVLVLDADFGTANIDIIMGIFPKYNISHLFYDNKTLEDVIIDGPYSVKILPGVSGMANLTSLTEHQKEMFFNELEAYQKRHKLDYILIDTGAGLGNNVINFLLAADEVIVVVTPEPTSLSDAYAIIKILNQYNQQIKVSTVINMVKDERGAHRVFETLRSVSEKFLDKDLNYLGFLKYDRNVTAAVKQQKPLLLTYPNSDVSMEILRLSNSILSNTVANNRGIRSFFEVAGKYFGWNHD